MKFFVVLPDIPQVLQLALYTMCEIIGDLRKVPDNHKFLAKFLSGTLRIPDLMRLMSLFSIIA